MTSKKRRQFWIDPPVQSQILVTVLVLVTGSVLLVAYSLARGLEAASTQSGQMFHSLDWFAQSMRMPLVVSAAVAVLASGLIALVWSHRFAGPLRVLAAAMERLKNGDFVAAVSVRDNDTLKEIVDDFADMQAALRGKLHADRDRARKAAARLAEIAAGLQQDHPARQELEGLSQEVKQVLAQYRL